jgi:flavin-dependent dehydrogenase
MQADVAIIGAGTAGAAAAALCARAGLSTVCVDRRPLAEAGARWINGVPAWSFDEAGIDQPAGEELHGAGHAFHLVSGWGPERIVMTDHEVLEVDMRHLVARLQRMATDAGARLEGEVEIGAFDGRELESSAGTLRARWFVDASGLGGARLLRQPRVARGDLCAAAQEVRAVSDLPRARAFFEEHGVRPGDTACFTGIAGGYSIVNVRLDGDRIGLLTGSIPADGHPSGQQLLDDFVAEHDFIGPTLFGGARAVPLRRPLDRLATDRVALLGDAACQVFSAHGSGIGAGMVAARMLADALSKEGDPQAYAVAWQRRYGGLFAAYDVFRRFSQTLGPDDLERLMTSGLLDEAAARAGLLQRLPALELGTLGARLRALLRERRLARKLAGVGARMAAAGALYARYPEEPARLERWAKRASRLLDAAAEPD